MTHNSEQARCKALTKNGRPCQAAPGKSGFCHFHASPGKAAEIGRRGGYGNRRYAIEVEPLSTPMTLADVMQNVSCLFAEVRAGRMSPRTMSCFAPLLNVQLRAIELMSEQRIRELEKSLVKPNADSQECPAYARKEADASDPTPAGQDGASND